MKRYIKPELNVVNINIEHHILEGSSLGVDPSKPTTTQYSSFRHTILDDDEDEEW